MTLYTENMTDSASAQLQHRIGRLVAEFCNGRQPEFLAEHSRCLDDYFRRVFENSRIGPSMGINRNPYAIIALGGYGRQEQCVHSDVDLLFLFAQKIPAEAETLIREVIYPLWDLGMEVGYATRTMRECLHLAADDFDILTPMLDARLVCGMSPLFSTLLDELHQRIIRKQSGRIVRWLVDRNRARHEHFGDSAYLLEPNLKEGQGGLRDYHTILWIARIEHQLKTPRDLEYFGTLSHDEYRGLRRALAFIWRVRNWQHYQAGRKQDRLRFEDQLALARALDYRATDGQQPVERFMGELHANMEYVKQQHLMFLHEHWLDRPRRRRYATKRKTEVAGLEIVKRGLLNFQNPEVILQRPELLMLIFEESARLRLPLSTEAKRLMNEFFYLVDDAYRRSPQMIAAFERILASPASSFNVLNEMLHNGFLTSFIPEFGCIVNRIQYDQYHLYPVGRHSLRAVNTVKQLARGDAPGPLSLAGKIYRELRKKTLLLWAVLLHDIGKGRAETGHAARGAEAARAMLLHRGYPQADAELVAFLVREHLCLIETATRRDIQDEETAILCARRIKTARRLKMLYLLTVADCMATGPAAWSEWTADLLRELFLKTLNVIENGELASAEAVAVVERKRREILSGPGSENGRHPDAELFEAMSPRYLLLTPTGAIRQHIGLYRRLQSEYFVWDVQPSADDAAREVTICAPDRPGLISNIAGVFTLNSINILDVQVFTWRNRIALDIFRVTPPPDIIFEAEKWQQAHAHLTAALSGALDLSATLKKRIAGRRTAAPRGLARPHRVIVDNATSSFFTIVEVYTYDFPGLLYAVTDALYRCGLNIWVAKIATKVDQVVDVFYVRDVNGEKVDTPEQVSQIEAAVLKRLPALGGSS